MKRLLLLIAVVTLATFLQAAPVPEATILLVAENWIEMYTGAECTIDSYQVINNGADEAMIYRIDFLPDGYVLIAADDSSLPILAYSDTGSILDTANPGREDLISQYTNQISEIKANNLANTYTLPIWSSISSKAATSVFTHLIDLGADWHQGAPYNNYCPYDDVNLGRSVVGCTATATSQIINYHKYWDHTLSSTDGYTSTKNGFTTIIDGSSAEDNFPNFITLNNYMNNVATKYQNHQSLDQNDIAALCFAAGIMDRTNYSSLASDATSLNAQFAYNNLNYNSQLLSRSSYSSDDDWKNLILVDLNADRPVQYVGRSAAYGGSGHVFILHGYRTENGVTQFKINWGWGADYNSGYYILTELNVNGTYNSYNYHHQMYHGVRPRVNLNQVVTLDGGTGTLSQIRVAAHRGGSTTTYSANYSGVFNIDLAEEGSYQFTFYHISGAYIPHVTGWIPMHKGSNIIQSTPIVLQSRPTLVHVPAQASTIQEGIDLVADGGTVIVASGTYSVNELSWANKHVRLLGSGNPVLTSGSHAIKLDWSGINNTDRIHGFTFQNCYAYDNGPAIMLLEGASPLVSNCTFDDNRVQGEYNMEFNNPSGYGGAVFIQGGSNQLNSPRFEYCTFTNNAAANGNGGGAVALFGPASFLSCTFTNNWTSTAVGFGPPAYFAAGAILIYGNDYNGDILIHNCTFTGNYGQNRANDIWVAGSRGINNLTIDNCTFNPDTSYSSEPVIRLFYDNMPSSEASTTDFILSMNKFNLSDKGAVYFHDYAGRCSMQFNNNVVNGLEGLTYGLKLHYYGGDPQNPDYFQFNNNTLLNLTSSGLVLFKGSDYTIENNIFHNCSPYDVEWGGDSGIPDYATESLTINNCFFNDLTNHVDTQGNAYQVFSIANSVVASDPQLHSDYTPLWNATTMSPYIDAGIGIADIPDCTPLDIGAYPAIQHINQVYPLPAGGVPKWMSFPVLNRITQGYDTAENFFAPISDVDVLDQVVWKVGNNQPEALHYEYDELENGNSQVQSVLGYKVSLQSGVTQPIQIIAPGFIQAPNTVINLYAHPAGSSTGVNENWIGYFPERSAEPFRAFSSIINYVTAIKTQNWSMKKDPVSGMWLTSSVNPTINYGDMVIVFVSQDCSFSWNNSLPVDPKVREKASSFMYTEKMDYTPLYLNLVGLEELPTEVGVYVNGICKGAVKVEGSFTDLCAYLEDDETITADNCELVLYYASKSAGNIKQACKLKQSDISLVNDGGMQYYTMAINSNAEINPVIPVTALQQNFPNPFNPQTTLSYELAEEGLVKLEIFNIKGQLIKTLVNETRVSGPHRIVWNGTDKYGRNVASGLYNYRLTTKAGSISKKMLLMK